ncbi:calcium uniporter protein, mitochondrial-like [Branchiostoma floridae]|uniref:Calcium uniporter protein n=1 Tax=Branchiostoma floridae TaxID=7739 RepID=A0A9J7KVB5_BRAFL|nr:calcium uniporter protein, mitochondrial-like [Branchiostoma floridae]
MAGCRVASRIPRFFHPNFSTAFPTTAAKHKIPQGCHVWMCARLAFSTSAVNYSEVTVEYRSGLPSVTVPLPSKNDRCRFTLKPISNTVGDFLRYLKDEDGGIERTAVYTTDDVKIAQSTTIDQLVQNDFKLLINDTTYTVQAPEQGRLLSMSEDVTTMDDIKAMISQLHTSLNIEQFQLQREQDILKKMEDLQVEIEPLEKVRKELATRAEKRTTFIVYSGLAYMALQFGLFARLTWWEYSWDIMEPVTYFTGYAMSMAAYAYFIVTRQEYVYQDAADRQYLLGFHKKAKKVKFDVQKYNFLKSQIYQCEVDLKRLRDPLQLHLPMKDAEDIARQD